MLAYLKMLIISLISGLFAPLPVSYGAQYSFLNSVLGFSNDSKTLGFYFSIISITFAVVAIIILRKIYSKSIKSLFSKSDNQMDKNYRKYSLNILISLIPVAVMAIPYGKGKFVIDIFTNLLSREYLLVTASCCIGCSLLMFVAMWYTRQNFEQTHRSATKMNIIRFSIYQIPGYIFPGISNVAIGTSSMLLTDVESETVVREMLAYFAPSVLFINIFRIVRIFVSGITVNPILAIIAALGSALGSVIIIRIIGRVNLRKLFLFFSIYSIVFGLFIAVFSFMA